MNEMDFSEFKDQGSNITGFSMVDYYSHNTIKLLETILQSKQPINKIGIIPV